MATIDITNTSLCATGLPAVSAAFGPVLRQKVDCTLTPLTGSAVYSIIKVPKGFVARHALINITTKSGTSGLTLSVGSNQKSGDNQIVYNAAVAATAVGPTLLDIDLPLETSDVNVSKKTVADDDTYIVIIPSATCNDAKFEISLAGDFMLNPAETNV